jgi:bla regulator protein blaR1
MISDFFLNHLWQSTLFAAAAALLALLFRQYHARVRYSLWLAASIKFLIPFSLFIAIGNSIHFDNPQSASLAQPAITFVQEISQPFGAAKPLPVIPTVVELDQSHLLRSFLFAAWLCGCLAVLALYLVKSRSIRAAVCTATPIAEGRAFEALQRLKQISGRRLRIRLACSGSSMEPGVFGIFRPVLLLPEGMLERLSDAQLDAIVAHELAHAGWRDNMVAAVHMFIEALFWFHPMIWWLGAKLVQERERACDEEVLRLGKDPQAYAEGILKICEFYLESPLACVAGITGSDMKKRIHAIMTQHIGRNLSLAKKLLLAGTGIVAIAIPCAIGFLNTPQIHAQSQNSGDKNPRIAETQRPEPVATPAPPPAKTANPALAETSTKTPSKTDLEASKPSFDVASIKPSQLRNGMSARDEHGRLSFDGVTLKYLIAQAYRIEDYQLSGGPGWVGTDVYTVEAKAANPEASDSQTHLMLQSLLEERFKLKLHKETREIQTYSLVIAKDGHKLKEVESMEGQRFNMSVGPGGKIIVTDSSGKPKTVYGSFSGNNRMPNLTLFGGIQGFANALSRILAPRRVIDKTGLTGRYEISLEWGREAGGQANLSTASGATGSQAAPTADVSGPSIFTAIQEQLGLKLEPDKGEGDFFVIDSVEKPTEN